MIIWLIALGILVGVGLWFMSGYNDLVHKKALVDEAWSGIDVQLKRRYDLIPNLVATVKQYSIHEKGVLEEVTRLRSVAMGSVDVTDKSTAEAGLTKALKTLFAVAENYPQLKANENFLGLQKELSALEHEVQLARRYYNGTARNYNIAVVSFPSNLIARTTHFCKAAYFEITAPDERNAPRVTF